MIFTFVCRLQMVLSFLIAHRFIRKTRIRVFLRNALAFTCSHLVKINVHDAIKGAIDLFRGVWTSLSKVSGFQSYGKAFQHCSFGTLEST